MNTFSPDDIDTANDMPAWVETEEKYRKLEDEMMNPTEPDYLEWYESCTAVERFTERQIAYQARTRPFSASWSYVDGGSISTMPPRIVNTDPTLHVQM
jgi:hypothetical protein